MNSDDLIPYEHEWMSLDNAPKTFCLDYEMVSDYRGPLHPPCDSHPTTFDTAAQGNGRVSSHTTSRSV